MMFKVTTKPFLDASPITLAEAAVKDGLVKDIMNDAIAKSNRKLHIDNKLTELEARIKQLEARLNDVD